MGTQTHQQTALRHPPFQPHQLADTGHFGLSLHTAAISAQTAGGILFGLLILIAIIYGIGVSLAIIEAKEGRRPTWLIIVATVIAFQAYPTTPWSGTVLNCILSGLRWIGIAIKAASVAHIKTSLRMQAAGITVLRVYAKLGWYGENFNHALAWLIVTGAVVEGPFTLVAMVLARIGVSDDVILLLYGMTLSEMTLLILAMLAVQSLSQIRVLPKFALRST